jgi:CRP-like cAMP-binding protein
MTHEPVSTALLQQFSPLDGLKRDNLAALARKVQVRELSPGQVLFKEGDTEKRTIYIVSGVLELQGKTVETIKGGSDAARNPVAPVFPRRVSAKARDRVQFISIDSDLLDVMLTWDQTGTYEVSELQGEADNAGRSRQRRRRLDDDAVADQGISQDPAREHPGDLHAHAADQLQVGRRHSQAGRRRRLFLCAHTWQRPRHA